MTITPEKTQSAPMVPGVIVVVRDEEWMVTKTEQSEDGWLVHVRGLSELVKDTTAVFYDALDDIQVMDPTQATVVSDTSPHYRKARLWIESTLRKTPLPLYDPHLEVSTRMLADPLEYQRAAVKKALATDNLRPRLLIADAVGLGKTLEIGMILSELTRRGRGDRILVVTPRHVLEQMQHELWCRFALPFVRLDSVGIQRVRQKLPATRNPFTYYKRAIISIDTLKSARYKAHLEKVRWDAVVIDESHNVTNAATQNNELARILAPNTETLILASATPHNGDGKSFAELLRLLDPTVVRPDGTFSAKDVDRLIVRRHRHSPEVAREVGGDWAERREPNNIHVPASPEEDAVAQELADTWLYPLSGTSPSAGNGDRSLFPWTLAKAFLSSPAALGATVRNRLKNVKGDDERDALERLEALTDQVTPKRSAKYLKLVEHLKGIGVAKGSDMRAVVFSERVDTLGWLKEHLPKDLGMSAKNFAVLHGGISDVEQQQIVDDFKRAGSDVRVLITGDVASEGVNLHSQCHELIHYDIPWSLIRIEQRNGRIDRYGQKFPPQITTLLLEPDHDRFSGDLRVLSRLMEREHEAHGTLHDVASLMGAYSEAKEETVLRQVLAGQKAFDDVVRSPEEIQEQAKAVAAEAENELADFDELLEILGETEAETESDKSEATSEPQSTRGLYATELDYLEDALREAFGVPEESPARGGVNWQVHRDHGVAELDPPADLKQRLSYLPQSYVADRKVADHLKLATTYHVGKGELENAKLGKSTSTWPEAHFLGPLHPVTEWASDRALSSMARQEIPAVRADVEDPTVLLMGTLMNKRGQVVSRAFLAATFEMPMFPEMETIEDLSGWLRNVGFTENAVNPGPLANSADLQELIIPAVRHAERLLAETTKVAAQDAQERIERWSSRADTWQQLAFEVAQRAEVKRLTSRVSEEQKLADMLAPDQRLLRPLLVLAPQDTPVAAPQHEAQTLEQETA
ncbi:helicase-related protein [Kocuria rosea]|uniref:helicase-related protein n=1 Tax=Kocuria rosea TaxID=1275 RepID=UPI000F71D02D|nr:helicase-related protein [Kocuria rosea]VEI51281.1 RNA polymerase-associated protein rapA [Kocuria rosea]